MIVCPECRHVNEEEATRCAACGRSLEPGPTVMVARRPDDRRPEVEIVTPKPPSRWPAFALLGAIVLAAVGAGIWYLLRPDPCRGTNFVSESFGYCLSVPDGWRAEPARIGTSTTLDGFSPTTQGATVLVEAVDLQQGAQLEQFADFVRQRDEQAGLTPGPITSTSMDGEPAVQWDLETAAEGGDAYRAREVVVVRDDVGWRVQLTDATETFRASVAPFHRMLESWRFR